MAAPAQQLSESQTKSYPCTTLQVYGCVRLDDFLAALAQRVERNATALDIFRRLHVPQAEVPSLEPDAPLQTKVRSGMVELGAKMCVAAH